MVTLGMDRCVDLLLSTPNQPIPEHGVVVTHTGEVLDLSIKEHQQGLWLYHMVLSPWQSRRRSRCSGTTTSRPASRRSRSAN
jgi:hypothetical protein